jgi:hypothetical protein
MLFGMLGFSAEYPSKIKNPRQTLSNSWPGATMLRMARITLTLRLKTTLYRQKATSPSLARGRKNLLALQATMSRDVHDMSFLSLHTGMRAREEKFSLWPGQMSIFHEEYFRSKIPRATSRPTFMTETVKAMLKKWATGAPNDLVFPGRGNKKILQLSDSFQRAAEMLG